jgi:hypothetical protein
MSATAPRPPDGDRSRQRPLHAVDGALELESMGPRGRLILGLVLLGPVTVALIWAPLFSRHSDLRAALGALVVAAAFTAACRGLSVHGATSQSGLHGSA